MTATVLGGKTDAEPQRQTRAGELQQAMQRFDALLVRDIEDERIRAAWQRGMEQWRVLSQAIASQGVTAAQSFGRHTEMIDGFIELSDRVTDSGGARACARRRATARRTDSAPERA